MVVGGILAREIRRFRSIILVSERGFVENAEILTRSLFESVLGERFILHAPLPLNECSPQLQSVRDRLPPIPAGRSREEFHTDLYASLSSLSMQRIQNEEDLDEASRLLMDQTHQVLQDSLGSDWMNVLKRHPRTYSGLTVRQLAENYGLAHYYQKAYGTHSVAVHANDALHFVNSEEIPDGLTINLTVATGLQRLALLPLVLRLASGMFGTILADINEAFSLGIEPRIDDLFARFKEHAQDE